MLLITDVTHSIPVQVLRNDVRVIASGTGHSDELTLDNVPRSVDIVKGDLLVTSGLGGRFPEGYPVGVVENVSRDGSNYFATVTVKPLASLERLRYVLLLWNEEMRKTATSPEDVRKAVQQRIEDSQQRQSKVKMAKPAVAEETESQPNQDEHQPNLDSLPEMAPNEQAVDPEQKEHREED